MSRLKILLYNPKSVFYDMPLALLSIGSYLDPDRYEVVIIDGRIEADAKASLLAHAENAFCMGVTALTGAPIRDALEMTQAVKKQYPDLPIVWGGWHPSLFPENTLRDVAEVDISVQGQGEETFAEILSRLENGQSMEGLRGACFREGSEIRKNPARPLGDLNGFPRVDYGLIDVEPYFRFKKRRQFDFISSTGCFFRCAFCADPFVFQRKWTALEPERMAEELAFWQKKYGFTDINFQDETFFTYRDRIVRLAEAFLGLGIKASWAGTMRADQGSRLSEEDFALCVKSGLRRLLIGVESGSQEMMDWLKKDIKMEQVRLCAERCRKFGIDVIFPFIVGFPGESDESVDASLDFALELREMSPGFSTPIFYFKPYPGSAITREVVEQGYQLPETIQEWADFDYVGTTGPWVSTEKYQRIERFKFYSKLAYRRKNPFLSPFREIARWRCRTGNFALPVEKILADTFIPVQKLS